MGNFKPEFRNELKGQALSIKILGSRISGYEEVIRENIIRRYQNGTI